MCSPARVRLGVELSQLNVSVERGTGADVFGGLRLLPQNSLSLENVGDFPDAIDLNKHLVIYDQSRSNICSTTYIYNQAVLTIRR